jgi:outer membrane lipoprotein SlyB
MRPYGALPSQLTITTKQKGPTMQPATPPSNPSNRAHPVLIAAAIAVTVFCLVATAAVMGWIPSRLGGSGSPALSEADRLALSSKMEQQANAGAAIVPQQPVLAAAPVSERVVTAAPAPQNFVPEEPVAPKASAPAKPAPPPRNWCNNCGNVESIREITTRAQGSGLGAGAGAVLGGLLGNQVGGGHGRQLATVAGAVGGAVVGNQVEGNMKATHSYEIRVRLDNGKYRTFHQSSPPRWRDGDRVRVVNGGLRAVS